MQSTPAGKDASHKYNLRRRLDTLRHGVLEPLIEPPLGFQEVLKKHFAVCRQRIIVQARRWALEARGTQFQPRFEKVYGQILSRFNEMDPELLELDPLKALDDDIKFISRHDPSFFLGNNAEKKRSAGPPAVPSPFAAAPFPLTNHAVNPWGAGFNPWEGSVGAAYSSTPNDARAESSEEDDFYS